MFLSITLSEKLLTISLSGGLSWQLAAPVNPLKLFTSLALRKLLDQSYDHQRQPLQLPAGVPSLLCCFAVRSFSEHKLLVAARKLIL